MFKRLRRWLLVGSVVGAGTTDVLIGVGGVGAGFGAGYLFGEGGDADIVDRSALTAEALASPSATAQLSGTAAEVKDGDVSITAYCRQKKAEVAVTYRDSVDKETGEKIKVPVYDTIKIVEQDPHINYSSSCEIPNDRLVDIVLAVEGKEYDRIQFKVSGVPDGQIKKCILNVIQYNDLPAKAE